jgi:CheY-like chemotaxis protein
MHVLIVDDEPQVLDIATQLFTAAGCSVLRAASGAEALGILAAVSGIDLVFSDVRMPGMSGFELAQTIRRSHPDLRVVLSSGFHGCTDCPATEVVPKPWRLGDIEALVRSARGSLQRSGGAH